MTITTQDELFIEDIKLNWDLLHLQVIPLLLIAMISIILIWSFKM